jgi:hypothetical protein
MFSDTPDFVAWTTHRPVVWVTREEYRSLPARGSATARATHGIDLPMQDRDEDTWFHPGLFETPLAPQGRGLSQEVCKRPQAAAL